MICTTDVLTPNPEELHLIVLVFFMLKQEKKL